MQEYPTLLILEDNTKYYGWSYSKSFTSTGEVVFNTGMTGYQEIMTDPSYNGQIVNFTYPELGNTGINNKDNESTQPFLSGIIAKNLCTEASNWRSEISLIDYLIQHNIPHIYGIDTRALTKHLRQAGTMNGCISTEVSQINSLIQLLKNTPKIQEQDLVSKVSANNSQRINTNQLEAYSPRYYPHKKYIKTKKEPLTVVVIDFGTKNNIIRNLSQYIDNVIVVSIDTTIEDILVSNPDGILLSNGPGDPQTNKSGIKIVKALLLCKIPLFGICMGHQILSIALGLNTFKLKFGHRGLNHPIGYNQNIDISSQNHGFAICYNDELLNNNIINQFNYNDRTVAAITHRNYPYFAVQYHPEASPGPHDSEDLFLHFIRIMKLNKQYPDLMRLKT